MVKRLALVAFVLMLAGCWGALLSQGFHTVAGPLGQYDIVSQRPEQAQMARYRVVEVAKFENTAPAIMKGDLVDAVQSEMVGILSRSGNLDGVVPVESYQKGDAPAATMVVTGTLLDITKDWFPGERVVSNANHLIARVKVLDKGTGRLLVEASLRGYVQSAVDFPQESLAKGVARAADRMLREVCGWKK